MDIGLSRNLGALAAITVLSGLLTGCVQEPSGGVSGALAKGSVAIEVAPLELSGVTEAHYTLTVTNGPGGNGDVVWSRQLTSSAFGDGAGSLSYVGPCDASTVDNTVILDLDGLDDASGPLAPGSYLDPTPLSLDGVCVANADVQVTFDMTIARRASQGFFDVAVSFEDVFCSAKKLWGSPRSGDSLRANLKPGGDHAERGDPQQA